MAYDRADYKTALKIWLPAAEKGDADAQNTVGEIFEQGLGTEPNYAVAALWYGRAADQGYTRAQVNLATLYETGKGVAQDKVKALDLYRQAWGVSDDALVRKSDATKALIRQAEQLAKKQLEQPAPRVMQPPPREVLVKKEAAEVQPVIVKDREFGRYHALLIGNADYELLDDLVTPVSDVERLARLLENDYQFNVRVLPNSNDAALLQVLNKLHDELDENDNLLVYYTGHGNRRNAGNFDVGYWLPINAEPAPNDTYWVPTQQVSSHLARLRAKRILVVADSSFAGLLADNPAFLLATDIAQLQSEAYVALRHPNRSRLLLTSGTDFPLQEVGNRDQSLFADAFIQVLKRNEEILTAPALYMHVLDELEERQPDLSPEFKAIKRAGDEVGDFFFVRQ